MRYQDRHELGIDDTREEVCTAMSILSHHGLLEYEVQSVHALLWRQIIHMIDNLDVHDDDVNSLLWWTKRDDQ